MNHKKLKRKERKNGKIRGRIEDVNITGQVKSVKIQLLTVT